MKSIGKVVLGMDEGAKIIVKSSVSMKDTEDRDDLYFVMFNVMAPEGGEGTLRLSIATVGCFSQKLVDLGVSNQKRIEKMIDDDPEKYLQLVVKHYGEIVAHGEEKVSIPLDSEENATKARAILTSLISNGCYVQVTRYRVPGADPEITERAQEVPTADLVDSLQAMLDIVKNWKTFDIADYLPAEA
jgi:hypothetical protein